jgi:hypothetical protein
MADSATNLDLIAVGQAEKEETANELFDALSPAALFGRRASTCTGLTWGYYGGRFESTLIANGTISLTLSATNYLVASRVDGTVSNSLSTTDWDDEANYIRLYKIVAGASTVTSYEDHRQAVWPWAGADAEGGGGLFAFGEIDYSDGSFEFETPMSPFTFFSLDYT